MSRCCCGGIPSFSSTRSLIRSTLRSTSSQGLPVVDRGRTMEMQRTELCRQHESKGLSSSAYPHKCREIGMKMCCGITLSVGSMSISISFPVSVWNRQGFHESYSPLYNLSLRSLGIYYLLRDRCTFLAKLLWRIGRRWPHLNSSNIFRLCLRGQDSMNHLTLVPQVISHPSPHPTPLESMVFLLEIAMSDILKIAFLWVRRLLYINGRN